MLNFLDPETIPEAPKLSRRAERYWCLAILLCAVFLRLFLLTSTPPGLTHDEADHGLSAWHIVTGEDRPIYFTVGNGREPLYDYATASLMSFLGPTFFAQRLTSVFFSLISLAATYALMRKLTNARIALLTIAGLSFGFWPLAVARQALRTITLLPFVILAIYFWLDGRQRPTTMFASGALLGLSFYTYLPARLLWLMLPSMLIFWALTNRPLLQQMWQRTLTVLLTAGAVSAPLWFYLYTNPESESRIGQLTGALTSAQQGDTTPLVENIFAGFRILALRGDTAWRYTIAERPLLIPFFAILFAVGLFISSRYINKPSELQFSEKDTHVLFLGWFLLGIAPVLITGPFLSSTQAIGLMPVLYFYPALLIDWMWRRPGNHTFALTAIVCLYGYLALDTAQAYFFDWANHPEVRLHHEHTLVTAVDTINTQSDYANILFSADAPGRYHDQPVALMTLQNQETVSRWFHGSHSLVLPAEPHLLVETALSPLTAVHTTQAFSDFAQQYEQLDFPAEDFDRQLTIWQIDDPDGWRTAVTEPFTPPAETAVLRDAVQLQGVQFLPQPDGSLQIQTLWQVEQAINEETVLFVQILGEDGIPIAQQDRLDVPSNAWVSGDHFIQIHTIPLPADTNWENLAIITGLYNQETFTRWPVTQGDSNNDYLFLKYATAQD